MPVAAASTMALAGLGHAPHVSRNATTQAHVSLVMSAVAASVRTFRACHGAVQVAASSAMIPRHVVRRVMMLAVVANARAIVFPPSSLRTAWFLLEGTIWVTLCPGALVGKDRSPQNA